MVDVPSEFRAHLESYRGPLDLLLFLIKKDEVDIFDIPIARIVEQYQIYLEILRQVDPNLCGEFLVTAAQLMEIKSKLLLPREELAEDEELEDPRLELVRQLLEYKKYKERSLLLERRMLERSRRHERPEVDLGPEDGDAIEAIDLGNVSIWDLFTAFHRIQLALGSRAPHRVVNRERPIEEYIATIKVVLSGAPSRTAPFEALFTEALTRADAIGLFLAILEMAKERLIAVFQAEIFGPIEVRLREEDEVRRILAAEAEPVPDSAERFLLEGEGQQALLEPVEEAIPPEGGPEGTASEPPAERPEAPAGGGP